MDDTAVSEVVSEYVHRPVAARPAIATYGHIRRAALALFAIRGVSATSIRMIAHAAEVSPGVVQHHFRIKEGLCDAVNENVRITATVAFGRLPAWVPKTTLKRQLNYFIEDHDLPLRYLARAIADEQPGALDVYRSYITLAERFLPTQRARRLVFQTLSKALLHPVAR